MRLQILSDLHIDINRGFVPTLARGIDALIVAGDVCEGVEEAYAWLNRFVPAGLPVVMVAGNHEHYGREINAETARAGELAAGHGVTYLENGTARLGHLRIVGTTLWTDYALFGAETRAQAMEAAGQLLMDHERIRLLKAGTRDARRFGPADALRRHEVARAYLVRELAEPHEGPTLVLTHHAPHERSVARQYATSIVTPAFVSDLADVIAAGRPALWVHGHTHASFDYRVGATRVICNPLGYGTENPAFDPTFVAEI